VDEPTRSHNDPENEFGDTIKGEKSADDNKPIFEGLASASETDFTQATSQPSNALNRRVASIRYSVDGCIQRYEMENVRDEPYFALLQCRRELRERAPHQPEVVEPEPITEEPVETADTPESPKQIALREKMALMRLEHVLEEYMPVFTAEGRMLPEYDEQLTRGLYSGLFQPNAEKAMLKLASIDGMKKVQRRLSKPVQIRNLLRQLTKGKVPNPEFQISEPVALKGTWLSFSLYRFEDDEHHHRVVEGATVDAISVWKKLRYRMMTGQSELGKRLQKWAAVSQL
jgi:hypothetical protein